MSCASVARSPRGILSSAKRGRGKMLLLFAPAAVHGLHAPARFVPHGLRRTASPVAGLFDSIADAAKGMASAGLENLEKEMAAAAMQEPAFVETADLPPARPLPDSFEDSITLAVDGVAETLADGSTRIVVEFDTSAGDETYNMLSRSLKFVQPFLPPFAEVAAPVAVDEPVDGANADAAAAAPPRIQLLFPDEGTAAYVRNNWADLPERTLCASLPRAQLAEGAEVLLLVAPAATEVPAVQRLLAQVDERAPATVVVLVNPKLVDMQSTGYGLVGRELRNMVADTFTVAFALKSYPEGALYRVYPGGWSVWREDTASEGGYTLAFSGSRRPSGDEVDELIYADGDEGGGGSPMDGLASFIKGFQAL